MIRARLSGPSPVAGFLRGIAALSVTAAVIAVPTSTAFACGPFDYFCTNPPPVPITPLVQQLIVNPSFEDLTPQTTPPHPGWIKSENAVFVTNPRHSGYEALEDDLGVLGALPAGPPQAFAFQDVTIPSAARQPVLRYYLDVRTSLTGTAAVDTLRVSVQPAQTISCPPVCTLPTTVALYSNLNNTGGAWCRKGDFDLSAFRGQTIRLSFNALINSAGPANATGSTRFFIDDVELWTEAPLMIVGPAC